MRAQEIGNGTLTARIPASFAAVLQALQLQGADSSRLRSLRDEEWRDLLPMMDRARLTLPFAQLVQSGIPSWVQDRVARNLAETGLHWEKVRAAYREAAEALDAAGVDYLVLKGFTQAPEYVAKPAVRRQSDIDFYLPSNQIPLSVRALEEIGYAPCQTEEDCRLGDHVPPLARFGAWKWKGNMYDPETPPVIELHFCFWNDAVYSIEVPEFTEFWNRRECRQLEGLNFPALHPVDQLGYFALHILRNIFSAESPAHHVRELAAFLHGHANDGLFWGEWAVRHSKRLRGMEAIALSLAAAWFSCSLPEVVRAEIDSLSPQVRSWIQTCGGTPLESPFRRTREGKLLQLLLADGMPARRKILWEALSPGRVSSPSKVATFGTHLTARRKPNVALTYLAYSTYLFSRVRMNGSAIVRFLARGCMLCLSRAGARTAWSGAIGNPSPD